MKLPALLLSILLFSTLVFAEENKPEEGKTTDEAEAYETYVGDVFEAKCSESEWTNEPETNDGVFEAEVKKNCVILLKDPKKSMGSVQLAKKIQNQVETTRKVIAVVPQSARDRKPASVGHSNQWEADTVSVVQEDGNDIEIREIVKLGWDSKSLTYKTDSKEVKASGMAGYLKKVGFTAEIRPQTTQGNYDITIYNNVAVERPWFAIALFSPIAKGVTKDKFKIACDRLFKTLSSYF